MARAHLDPKPGEPAGRTAEIGGCGGVRLDRLVREVASARLVGLGGSGAESMPRVTGVHQDSRQVEPGDLFVALRGLHVDGASFIGAAAERGAVAVMIEQGRTVDACGLPRLEVGHGRQAMAEAAAAVYGRPTEALATVGITGTNGKTTTAYLVQACLERAGCRAGIIGTLGSALEGWTEPSLHTSPEADELQRVAATLRLRGASHLVMEVSSIALASDRVHGVRFDVAAFTNLTQDHLDYHGSMEAYAAAKERLFFAPPPEAAVVMVDDAFGAALAERIGRAGSSRLLRVSSKPGGDADLRPEQLSLGAHGIDLTVQSPSGRFALGSPLVGEHNVANLLCAIGIVEALGLDVEAAADALAAPPTVPGRLERCDQPGQDDLVAVVDYAHSPDALARVLGSLRRLSGGTLWCVFGCGGDRDREKRAPMGEAVGRMADRSIVTNDNPRGEEPAEIARAVVRGLARVGARYEVELDRARAIEQAVGQAQAGDVVLVAGKGHESVQIVGDATRPFDDREIVREALARRRRQGRQP